MELEEKPPDTPEKEQEQVYRYIHLCKNTTKRYQSSKQLKQFHLPLFKGLINN